MQINTYDYGGGLISSKDEQREINSNINLCNIRLFFVRPINLFNIGFETGFDFPIQKTVN